MAAVDIAPPPNLTPLEPWLPASDKNELAVPERGPRLWEIRGVWLGGAAFLLSLLGTYLLSDEPSRPSALIALGIAALLGIIAWGGLHWLPAFSPYEAALKMKGWLVYLRLAGIAIASLFVWGANISFRSSRLETFGAPGWLWLAAMALLFLSTVGWLRRRDSTDKPMLSKVATPSRNGSEFEISQTASWTGWEIALLAGLVGLALLLRVWDLRNFPYAIHGDEIITGRTSIQSYVSGNNPSIFTTLWYAIDLPALWFVIVSASLKVGGITLEAVRLPAALFGAATVIPFYGIVRASWGRVAAISGTAILTFSASNIHYSRVTLNNIVTPFFWAVCFFFLLRGLRLRRPVDWVLAGLAGGLSEHFYYGTRFLPFLLAAFLVYLLVVHWRTAWRFIGHYTLMVLGYLAGFGPLLAYFTLKPDLYAGRGAGVLTWNRIPTSWQDAQSMWETLWPFMSRILLSFSTMEAQDSVYTSTLLMPIEAALLALGVALLIWRWRHPVAFLTLLCGFSVLFVGGTLIPPGGSLNHWTPAFPAFYAALAVPVGAWAASFRRFHSARFHRFGLVALAAALSVLAVLNIDFYFNRYHVSRPEFEVRAAQSRFQAALGVDYRVFNVGETWQGYDPETNSYLIKGQEGAQLNNPSLELPVEGMPGKGLAFFFFPGNELYLDRVKALYPGGTTGEVKAHGGTHLFYTYMLTPERAKTAYGVRLELSNARFSTPWWSGRVERVGSLPPGEGSTGWARWSGLLYVPQGGGQLKLEGDYSLALLEGQPLSGLPTAGVAAGWHAVVVEASLPARDPVRLKWGPLSANTLTELTMWNLVPVSSP